MPSFQQRSSLKTKATFFAIAISVLPIIGAGAIQLWNDHQTLKEKATKAQEANTLLLADGFSRFMFERSGDIQLLAELPFFADSRFAAESSAGEKQKALNNFLQTHGVYDGVAFADLNGNVTSEVGIPLQENLRNKDYFQEVLKTKKTVIATPQKAKVTGLYSIFIAAPVLEISSNKLLGVVVSRIPVTRVEEFFIRNNPSLRGEYFFADGNGVIFGAANGRALGKSASEFFRGFSQFTIANPVTAADQPRTATIADSANGELLGSYVPLKSIADNSNLKWNVLLVQRASALQNSRLQLLMPYLGAIAAIAIVVGTLATLLTRRLVNPVLQAASAVQQFGEGNLDTRLKVTGKDELALLGTNINLMADQIQPLLEQRQLETENAQFLKTVTQHMVQAFKPEERLKIAVSETRQALKVDRVIAIHFDENWMSTIAAESVAVGLPKALGLQFSDQCFAENFVEQYRLGRVRAVSDLHHSDLGECHIDQLKPLGVRAKLVAPIVGARQLLGLLIAHDCGGPRDWKPSEIDLFSQVATQIGLSWQQSLDGLQQMMLQMERAAVQANTHLETDQSVIRQFAEQAVQQSEQIAQTLSSVQQMALSIRPLEVCVNQAATIAEIASKTANDGQAVTESTMQNTVVLRETVANTLKKVKLLGEFSQEISTTVSLFNEIAQRTNLLVVNASLANRTGGQEQGFAIVTGEIGDLASLSAAATEELEVIVGNIQRETSDVVQALDLSATHVVEGTHLVGATKQSLEQMLEISQMIDQLVQSLTTAKDSQAQTVQEVTHLIQDLAKVSKQTSDGSLQISQSLQQTATAMHHLQGTIHGLQG